MNSKSGVHILPKSFPPMCIIKMEGGGGAALIQSG